MAEPRRLKSSKPAQKSQHLKKAASKSSVKVKGASRFLKRQINIPLPDNKLGRTLGKKGSLVPGFLKNAWQELRQVRWPNREETVKLTFAVLVFTLGVGLMVAGVDFVLERIFKEVILP